MEFAFLTIVILFLLYSCFKWPGIAISYLFFFQILNNLIFEQVGMESVKYITFVVILPLLYFKYNSRSKALEFKRLLFNSVISKVYFFLLFYIFLYTILLGTNYETLYLKKFIFPGTIFFVLALYFFNDIDIYKEVVIGVIIFSLLTLIFLYYFKGISSMLGTDRLEISDEIGMGPIVQGRMAGMLGLTLLVLFLKSNKFLYKFYLILLFILSFIWLALSGSRGPAVALSIMILVYSILNRSIFKVSISIFIFSLIAIPILANYGIFDFALFERLTELSSQEDIESMHRFRRYLIFFDMPPKTFIFGLGPGGWGKHIALSPYRFPHNIIVESLVEHGVVGAVFIFTVLLTGFRQLYKKISNINSNLYINIILLWWGFYFLNTMVSGGFIQGNINFFTLTAILACINNKKSINAI
jgi:O-antigen ligase